MKKLFIPYELAVIAKEKGFDELCIAVIHKGGTLEPTVQQNALRKNSELVEYMISAPMYQQIVDWFREKHNISICVDKQSFKSFKYRISNILIEYKGNDIIEKSEWNFDDYYKAMQTAITEAFKLI